MRTALPQCSGRLAALVLLTAPLAAHAQVPKATAVPGYAFVQITDNNAGDHEPRVSASAGLVTWTGRYNRLGALSRGTDFEIFLWDGSSTEQVTDNDVADIRPVVNAHRDLAWQTASVNGYDADSEIMVRRNGVHVQVTSDVPPVFDRYPDINDDGLVVWGRSTRASSSFDWGSFAPAVLHPGSPTFVHYPYLFGYRPRLNALGHFTNTVGQWIRDADAGLVAVPPPPAVLGFQSFAKATLDPFDRMVMIGRSPDGSPPTWSLLRWGGGSSVEVLASGDADQPSIDPDVSRPDSGAAGFVAWEALGGLPGSRSGPDDWEVFVFEEATGITTQLTDDDVDDLWPSVLEDGSVVWTGQGGYPGAISGGSDAEIFLARRVPYCADGIDNDSDGWVDTADPGCRDALGATESPECQDGINNDPGQDALVDFDGGASLNRGVPLTSPDPQCEGRPWRDREARPLRTCGLGYELALLLLPLAWWRHRLAKAAVPSRAASA